MMEAVLSFSVESERVKTCVILDSVHSFPSSFALVNSLSLSFAYTLFLWYRVTLIERQVSVELVLLLTLSNDEADGLSRQCCGVASNTSTL